MAPADDFDGTGQRGRFDLYCNWQGCIWQQAGRELMFIESAVGWVDPIGLDDPADGPDEVHVSFGRRVRGCVACTR